jgi:uroporphyrinogen decarboxylase
MSTSEWNWKPDPDYTRLMRSIRIQGSPQYVPLLEYFADPEIVARFFNEPVQLNGYELGTRAQMEASLDQRIRFWHALGYDAIVQGPVLEFPGLQFLETADTAKYNRSSRKWVNGKSARITSWADFESYPWPKAEDADYFPLEYLAAHLPEGMGILAEVSVTVYELLSWLMGYEALCFALYEQPELVEAITERIQSVTLPVVRAMAQMDRVIGLWQGDDLGFKTSTLISPKHLRRYILPIHREIAATAHRNGLPFFLHSCGNLSLIMEDLITDVKIDAKHSFEDAIEPVEKFYLQYGKRVAIIGGIDVDLLSRGTEEQVRQRTREVLQSCAPGGGYILGSGNSITNYIPLNNFLAMVDEGWKFNQGEI